MAEVFHFSFAAAMAALMIAVGFSATDDPQTTVVRKGCSPVPAYTNVNATTFYENLNSVLASLLPNLFKNGFAFSGTEKAGKTDPDLVSQCGGGI